MIGKRNQKSVFLFVVALFAIACGLICAQELSRISLVFNATTVDSKRIVGINPDNFRATLDRSPVKVKVAANEAPHRLVLLLDASISMTEYQSGWDMAILAARRFVESVPKSCSLGMIVFGADVIREVRLGDERREITEALDDLAHKLPKQKLLQTTAAYDAIERAVDLLSPGEPGDAIYAVTDAQENSSKMKRNRLKGILLQKQIRLFLFLLDTLPVSLNAEGAEVVQLQMESMRDLSTETGGTRFVFQPVGSKLPSQNSKAYRLSPGEMNALYQRLDAINELIFHFYRLDLELPSLKTPAKLSLEILDQNAQPMKNVRLLYNPRISVSEIKNSGPEGD